MDAINREQTIKAIKEIRSIIGFNTPETAIYSVISLIERQPTIDPESLRPVGRWETVKRQEHYPSLKEYEADYCSNCGKRGELEYSYCPHCGARMEVQDDG